jgi:hypothetical protein
MHNRFTSLGLSSLSLLTLLSPAFASAALPDILEKDLDALEQSLENDAIHSDMQQREWARESVNELFPEIPVETKGALEQAREGRVGDFLSVMIDGIEVIFRDVPIKEWFAPYVRVMAEAGVVSGYKDANGVPLGLFKPANPVSIEELAKILVVRTDTDMETCPQASRNITASGSWSSAYMACAESKQWVVYSDGTVDAKRPATRAEVIATVLQAYKKESGDAKGTVFKDVEVSMQFAGAIEKAHADGIVIGYTDAEGNALGMFGPSDDVKRAEIAKMLTIAHDIYASTD